jgi:hypothetical protein
LKLYHCNQEIIMPTNKGKDKDKIQLDKKEDDRRKIIDDLNAKIQSLYEMNYQIQESLEQSRQQLEDNHRKRVKKMKAQLNKMIDKGDVESLGIDCDV